MLFHLLDGDAVLWTRLENPADEIANRIAAAFERMIITLDDSLAEIILVGIIVGERAVQDSVEDHTDGPDIDGRRVRLTKNHFGRVVRRRAADGLEKISTSSFTTDRVGQTEIGDLNREVLVEKNVFELEIAMNDLTSMTMLDTSDELPHELEDLLFLQISSLRRVVEQVSVLCIFHHQVHLPIFFEEFNHLHNVGMLQFLECLDLPLDPLHSIHGIDSISVINFDGDFLLSLHVNRRSDCSETALADHSSDGVISYDLAGDIIIMRMRRIPMRSTCSCRGGGGGGGNSWTI